MIITRQQLSSQTIQNKKLYSLKKLFSVPKPSKSVNKQNDPFTINPNRSLLLTKNNPLCILKVPKIRKKIYLDQSQQKQLYSAIQSMQQKGFIQQNSMLINSKIYHDIMKKIQQTKLINRKLNGKGSRLPEIQKWSKNIGNNYNHHNNHDKIQQQFQTIGHHQKLQSYDISKNTLINPESQQLENLFKNQYDMKKYKTNQLRSKRHSNIHSVNNQNRVNSFKQQADQDNFKTIIVKSKKISNYYQNQLRKDSQQQQIQMVNRNQSYRSQYLQQQISQTINENNDEKYHQSDQNNNRNLFPSLTLHNSQSQQNLSVIGSSQPKHKIKSCYMKYHQQARKFFFSHKQDLQIPPKIKDFLITGISATSYFCIDFLTLTPLAYRNFQKRSKSRQQQKQ